MKLPNFKRTYEFYKRLADLTSYGKIASISGVTTDTADDWARPVESDDFPTGTGKKNTTDTVLRQIRTAHTKDAGLAREWANAFPEYVDFLDEQKGISRAKSDKQAICGVTGESAKEHLDIVVMVMNSPEPDFELLDVEIQQFESKFLEFKACVKEQRKARIQADNFPESAEVN